MIPITKTSVIRKSRRVVKYVIVLFVLVIVCGMIDAAILHWIADPWYVFADNPKIVMGAMAYRLLSTWEYE